MLKSPKPGRFLPAVRIEPDAFILHDQHHLAALVTMQLDTGVRDAGVLGDVEEQFAGGLKEEDPDFLGLGVGGLVGLDVNVQAVLVLHPPGQPVQGGGQSGIVEDGRGEFDGQGAGGLHGLVDQVDDLGKPFAEGIVAQSALQRAGVELAGSEKLLEVVVEHLGQPAALPLLGMAEFGGHGPQLLGPLLCDSGAFGDALFQGFIKFAKLLFGLLTADGGAVEGLGDGLQLGDADDLRAVVEAAFRQGDGVFLEASDAAADLPADHHGQQQGRDDNAHGGRGREQQVLTQGSHNPGERVAGDGHPAGLPDRHDRRDALLAIQG
jgi:hypothetical protein